MKEGKKDEESPKQLPKERSHRYSAERKTKNTSKNNEYNIHVS